MPAPAGDLGLVMRADIATLRADLDQARAAMKQTRGDFKAHGEAMSGAFEGLHGKVRGLNELTRGLGATFGGVKGEALRAAGEIALGWSKTGAIGVGIAALAIGIGLLTEHFLEIKKAAKEAQDFANSTADSLTSYQNQQATGYEETTKHLREQLVLLKDGATAARAYGVAQLDAQLKVLQGTAAVERLRADKADTDRLEAKNAFDAQQGAVKFTPFGGMHGEFAQGPQLDLPRREFDTTDAGKTLKENAEKAKQSAESAERELSALRELLDVQKDVNVQLTKKEKKNKDDEEYHKRLRILHEFQREGEAYDAKQKEAADKEAAHQLSIAEAMANLSNLKADIGDPTQREGDRRFLEFQKLKPSAEQIAAFKRLNHEIEEGAKAWKEQQTMAQGVMNLVGTFSDFMAQSFLAPLRDGFKGIGQIMDGLKNLLLEVVAKLVAAAIAAAILSAVLPGLGVVNVAGIATSFGSLFGKLGGFAGGGPVSGSGSGTSDSILARLSAGEYVMPAAAVQKWGVGFMDQVASRGYASGGMVSGGASSVRGGDVQIVIQGNATMQTVHEMERVVRKMATERVGIMGPALASLVPGSAQR